MNAALITVLLVLLFSCFILCSTGSTSLADRQDVILKKLSSKLKRNWRQIREKRVEEDFDSADFDLSERKTEGPIFTVDELANSFVHGRKILFNGDYFVDTINEPTIFHKIKELESKSLGDDADIVSSLLYSLPQQVYVHVKDPVPTNYQHLLKKLFNATSEVYYHPHHTFVFTVPSIGSTIKRLKTLADDRILWVGLVDPLYKISPDLIKSIVRKRKLNKNNINTEVLLLSSNEIDIKDLVKQWKDQIKGLDIETKKKDRIFLSGLPLSSIEKVLKTLCNHHLVRHIQPVEKFGFDGDMSFLEDEDEEEGDFPLELLFPSESKRKVKKQRKIFSQSDDAANKLLSADNEYSLEDSETFQLLSAINPLSDAYKKVLFKFGPTKEVKNVSYKATELDNHDRIGQPGLPDVMYMWEKGFTGKNSTIAIGDTGIDTNNCLFFRKGQRVPYNKVDFNSHDKFIAYRTYADDGDMVRGHGTFVSAITVGNIQSDNFEDGEQMKDLFDGVQKDSKLCFFDVGLPTHRLSIPHDLSEEYFPFMHRKCKAKISSHSWGSPRKGAYTITSKDVDEWAYENPDTVQLFAAGNSGRSGTQTITAPGTCKNCITVGSSQWTRKNFQLGYPLYGDVLRHEFGDSHLCNPSDSMSNMFFQNPMFCRAIGAPSTPCFSHRKDFCARLDTEGEKLCCNNIFLSKVCCSGSFLNKMQSNPEYFTSNNVATFSSRGPCTDHRIKPDIIAPGQLIFSARSLASSSSKDGEQQNGYCATPMANQGTSFSTPLVLGYANMIHQYFKQGYNPNGKLSTEHRIDPIGSTLKAVLVNSGQTLTGMVETNGDGIWRHLNKAPSFTQGFGLVRVRHVLPFAEETDFNLHVFQEDKVSTDDYKQYCFKAVDVPSKKDHTFKDLDQTMKATLVWTDYPGSPSAKIQLVNNLDLVIKNEKSGQELYGNGGRDYVNNVEQVTIHDHDSNIKNATEFRVVVLGTNVPKGPQSFSLVVTGPLERIECKGEPELTKERIVKEVPGGNESNNGGIFGIISNLFSGKLLVDQEGF
ncbi:hypothetical protein ABK040_001771 [Willaertia magna]